MEIDTYVLITRNGEYYTQPYSGGYSNSVNKVSATKDINRAYLFNRREINTYKFLDHVAELEAIEHRTVELIKKD